jgi:hypothetical protein
MDPLRITKTHHASYLFQRESLLEFQLQKQALIYGELGNAPLQLGLLFLADGEALRAEAGHLSNRFLSLFIQNRCVHKGCRASAATQNLALAKTK